MTGWFYLKMNKRADAGNFLQFFIKFIPVFIVSGFIAIVAWNYLNEDINTHNLETYILTKDLLYSDSCLALSDSNVHPMTIDVKKISDEKLASCFTKSNMGYRITLLDKDKNEVKSAKSLTVRQEGYLVKTKSGYPVCKSIPEYRCSQRIDPILYSSDDNKKLGFLVTEVINFVG